MAKLWSLVLQYPWRTLFFCHSFLAQILLILLRRILLPHFPAYQSLRIQLQRAYLSSAVINFPDLTHRLPVGKLPDLRARQIDSNIPAYLVPGNRQLRGPTQPKCVVLYAHGGGYARGEARMYLKYMERWTREAASKGLDLVFLSVEYPLSTESGHPAQLDTFLKTYRYLLDQEVAPGNIVFMGDSAGGGLSILCGFELKRLGLPQPAATVLISPWIDMESTAYEGGNAAVETDYFVAANEAVPALIKLFIGERSPISPEINPFHHSSSELNGLSPQLILVGGGEFAIQDSKKWAQMCKAAGIECTLTIEWGQLHIYAMGSDWIAPSIRQKTDNRIIDWIQRHIN